MMLLKSTPGNSILQEKEKKVQVIRSFELLKVKINYIENGLKGNENYFVLAGGSS